MISVQVLRKGRLRVVCDCGLGMCINIPEKGHNEFKCSQCGNTYTVNFHGDVYCHKCQEKLDKEKMTPCL